MKRFLFLLPFVILLSTITPASAAIPNYPKEETNGKWAMVAGGSRGIGKALATSLAKRGYNLLLIARNPDTLLKTADSIEGVFKVKVITLSQDLSKPEAPDHISAFCFNNNLPISVLCNVAGLGGDEDFLELPEDSLRYMIRLNLENPIMLTNKMLPLIEKHAPGYILNVASMAGFAPMPTKNVYSSTKAGLISFSYALRYQLKDKNISVSVLAPGPVYTKPKIVKTTREELGFFGDWIALSPEFVGEKTIQRLLRGRLLIVPGGTAKVSSWVIRGLPKRWMTSLYYAIGKNPSSKK